MNAAKNVLVAGCCCILLATSLRAETIFYELDNVFFQSGAQMTGIFSWTFDPEEFGDGSGQFLSLDIPYTAHGIEDLTITIDPGSSIEFTLNGNFHDDGVDVTLRFLDAMNPDGPADLDLEMSTYDIGGNGFHAGVLIAGRVTPLQPELNITHVGQDQVELSWEPDIPIFILQESDRFLSPVWVNAPSGNTNPITLPATDTARFYRLVLP